MTVACRHVIDERPQRQVETARPTQEEQETYELHDSSSYRIISAAAQTGRAPAFIVLPARHSVRRVHVRRQMSDLANSSVV